MSELSSERPNSWSIYTTEDPSPSQPTGVLDRETPWKNFGSSMNAISFGFVATAILISMFLIMAIFEHLFRPNPPFSSPPENVSGRRRQPTPMNKHGSPETVYASDYTVVMPGQEFPTYIAQPAPLPCGRERVCWPSHQHNNFVFP